MHIVTLMATDFLRLRAVEVEPDADGGLVVIRGRNAQGKSSVLKAIQAAIGGKTKETVPIRKGAERAEVVVRLEGEGLTMPYTVRRTFTPAGQRLEITTDEGDRKAAPQKILDAFLGDLTFDPLVFSRLAPGAQREVLMHTAGMDCSGIDAEIDAAREDRMVIGREVRRIEGAAMSAAPPPGDVPDEPVDAQALAQKVVEAKAHNAENRRAEADLESLRAGEQAAEGAVDRCRAALAEAEAAHERALNAVQTKEAAVAGVIDVPLEPLEAALAKVNETNELVARKRAHAQHQGDLANVRAEHKKAEKAIRDLEETKRRMLADAELPVEGLAVDAEGVIFNGLPLAQASQAEALRVSVAVGMAANPSLKVMLIEDGSLLDDENMALLAELARERDYHIWIERVEDGPGGVVIEDGMIAVEGAD